MPMSLPVLTTLFLGSCFSDPLFVFVLLTGTIIISDSVAGLHFELILLKKYQNLAGTELLVLITRVTETCPNNNAENETCNTPEVA